MKILVFLMIVAQATVFAQTNAGPPKAMPMQKGAPPPPMMNAKPDKPTREKVAAVYTKLAECLRSEKDLPACQMEAFRACQAGNVMMICAMAIMPPPGSPPPPPNHIVPPAGDKPAKGK